MTDPILQRIAAMEAQLATLRESVLAAPVVTPQTGGDFLHERGGELGPIRKLLDDDTVEDIMINAPDQVYVERQGKIERTDVMFQNEAEVLALAHAIARNVGRTVGAECPLLDARLPDGSRVNVIVKPLAIDGTTISIRKFAKRGITLDTMAKTDNISANLAQFLKVAAKCRLNIVISGGTGSGKTTLLNAISEHIEASERIVTIEDAAELRLQQPHVVRLETRPMRNSHYTEEVSIRDLAKNALRMRPDRILVGEVRGAEAFDMMQAMNTGHEGSLTTIHANHPRDALARLENMINMANLSLPNQAIRSQIASAVHLIIQVSRMRDGHRRISFISEVVGMESDVITMQDLFVFQPRGEDANGRLTGDFRWTGIMPRFVRRAGYYGQTQNLSEALGVTLPKI